MTDRGYLLDLLDLLEGMQNVCGIKCPDYIAQLRERLAQEDPWVKTYCGGKPNYTKPVHASDITQERVDEKAKRKHDALDKMVAENQNMGLYEEVPCKTHPDAPHGFDRNASHSEDRYVCECEYWEPPPTREWAGLTDQDFADMVVITLDSNGSKFDSRMFARYIEAVLREKNT